MHGHFGDLGAAHLPRCVLESLIPEDPNLASRASSLRRMLVSA